MRRSWVEDLIAQFFVILVIRCRRDALHAERLGDVNRINARAIGADESIVSAFGNFETFTEQPSADASAAITFIDCHAVEMQGSFHSETLTHATFRLDERHEF